MSLNTLSRLNAASTPATFSFMSDTPDLGIIPAAVREFNLVFLAEGLKALKSGLLGSVRYVVAGTAISSIIPTNPTSLPGITSMRMRESFSLLHLSPWGTPRGRKMYPPDPRTVFFPSQKKVNSPSNT